MKYGESRGIKTLKWYVNEILKDEDINALGKSTYQNFTDHMATLVSDKLAAGVDVALNGLNLVHDTLLDVDLITGAAVSMSGAYLNSGVWGFSVDSGSIFSVVIPDTETLSFSAGGAQDRIDIVEIRPTEVAYESVNRNFKDPVTTLVGSSLVNTRVEYGFEYAIREGTEAGSPVANVATAGWIKIAEVYVAASASSIAQSNIKDIRGSWDWTTGSDTTMYPTRLSYDVLTTTERNNLQHPRVGMLIYNTTQDRLNVRAYNAGSQRWEYPDGTDAT